MAGRSIRLVAHRAFLAALLAATLVPPSTPSTVSAPATLTGPGSGSRVGSGDTVLVRLRPTDGQNEPEGDGYTAPSRYVCGPHLCVHWVATTNDAPPLVDANGNGVPDQVDRTLDVFEAAWAFEVGRLAFRAPRSDRTSPNHGPDGRLDVYLVDVGGRGLDGYVATDDPRASDDGYRYRNYSAYVVVDDDFAVSQLGSSGGSDGLRVTAAHELFHAVQYAYDAGEDDWLMEGTAAWMEDQFADDVNTNRVWLGQGPLEQPWISLDSNRGLREYGAWIFFRYLSESMRPGGSDPSIIRRVWELAADGPGSPNLYSARAVAQALAARRRQIGSSLAAFGAWNLLPAVFYEEGAAYARAPLERQHRLGPGRPVAGWVTLRLDHLTTAAASFEPAPSSPARASLRLLLDAPARRTGSGARLMIVMRTGAVRIVGVALDRRGDAELRVPFGRATVSRVVLVLANGNTRFDCWTGAGYSCNGRSRADRMPYSYVASLVR